MFTLEQVVPWGRSFDEYHRMFALEARDFEGAILGCGDGPAAFNGEATRRVRLKPDATTARVISCDPLYAFDTAAIRARIDATRADILEQTRKHRDEFVWTSIRTCCSCTACSWARNFTAKASWSCAVSRARCGSSRC